MNTPLMWVILQQHLRNAFGCIWVGSLSSVDGKTFKSFFDVLQLQLAPKLNNTFNALNALFLLKVKEIIYNFA